MTFLLAAGGWGFGPAGPYPWAVLFAAQRRVAVYCLPARGPWPGTGMLVTGAACGSVLRFFVFRRPVQSPSCTV